MASAFPEDRTFRIDHYLGKETVQNLLALRFANSLFEPLWNSTHIDHVQITVAETIGLEGRGDYYDQAGALRDMVQNHMLQLLALVAMEPPTNFDATAVRDEKVKVLRALRPIAAPDVEALSVTGQYTRGAIDGETVPGYDEEIGHDSQTETFVALKANIDNWRWKGVPFYLRTGKRMPMRDTEIFIQFRDVPYSIFASRGATTKPNKLIIGVQPEETISLHLMSKTPGLDRQGVRLARNSARYRPRQCLQRISPPHSLRAPAARPDRGRPDPVRPPRRGRGAMDVDRPHPRRLGGKGHDSAALCGRHLGTVGRDRAGRARRHQLARVIQ